jgi:hypothetical protein
MPVDVRFGSKAEVKTFYFDVRFTPKSRHSLPRPACPLCAKSGHMQCSKKISRRALHARDSDIRSHVGAHLSVPKKWSKVCVDRRVQFE